MLLSRAADNRFHAPHLLLCPLAPPTEAEIEEYAQWLGGGTIGSERFIQDYGFLDPKGARQWDRDHVQRLDDEARASLLLTSLEEDYAALASGDLSVHEQLALGFRINLKEAMK